MGKYRITWINTNSLYFITDSYRVDGLAVTFITIPEGIRTTIVGSFMIEELIQYER